MLLLAPFGRCAAMKGENHTKEPVKNCRLNGQLYVRLNSLVVSGS